MIIVVGVVGYEWFKFMFCIIKNVNKFLVWGFGLLSVGFVIFVLYFIDIVFLFWVVFILCWLFSLYWVKFYLNYDVWYNLIFKVVGIVLIFLVVIVIFVFWKMFLWWLMYLFLLVWGVDSGVYFVGCKLGKCKFVFEVSLNKLLEGFYGGVIIVMIIVVVVEIFYLDLMYV